MQAWTLTFLVISLAAGVATFVRQSVRAPGVEEVVFWLALAISGLFLLLQTLADGLFV